MASPQDVIAALLRRAPPEAAHNLALWSLAHGFGPRAPARRRARLEVTVAGLRLSNPLGLAAGFDKDARVPDALIKAGFGFVEVGTVTPRPQAGNPRPRLFRLKEDAAVINRMGFNNEGLETFAERLAGRRSGPVGANLGANKDSADKAADYVIGLRRVHDLADYVTINVSSPNTPGLRGLQSRDALEDLLGRLAEARGAFTIRKPLFLKVAPDLDEAAIGEIAALAPLHGVDGLIVSNTTIERPAHLRSAHRGESGGLSGRPLFARSTEVLRAFARALGGRLPLIGVGGVEDAATALAKIKAGASAVQLYTALTLQGPGLIPRLLDDLDTLLAADGFASVADAVGVEAGAPA